MQFSFSKYAGSGNDFILLDNRDLKFSPLPDVVRAFCDRKRGVGADGLIILSHGSKAPFLMRIFNADGSEADMCGNGLRCFKLFLEELGVRDSSVMIETRKGLHEVAKVGSEVKASMENPRDLQLDIELENGLKVDFVNTGVPHAIVFVDDIEKVDVVQFGRFLRNHPHFQPEGANANFVEIREDKLFVRTYERGVEDETLACGTGATASAIIAALKYGLPPPISVVPRSLERIVVDFKIYNEQISCVTQTGPAQSIFQGSFIYATPSL